MKAFAATVWLAMRMPAALCRARIAESHSLDSMLMKCMLALRALGLRPISRCSTVCCALVLVTSCPIPHSGGAGLPVGVEGNNNHYLKLIAIVDSTVR